MLLQQRYGIVRSIFMDKRVKMVTNASQILLPVIRENTIFFVHIIDLSLWKGKWHFLHTIM